MKIKVIILILFSILVLRAQIQIERINLPEGGVPLHLTFCMMQDSKGFIWFGTMYGLVRYDGKDYKIFRHDPDNRSSISFDDIVSLNEDKKGNIWIGTWGGGLNLLNPVKQTFKRFPSEKTGSIIWKIKEDSYENTWFISEPGKLVRYNPKDEFRIYPLKNVKDIFINNGIILAAGDEGVFTWSQKSDSMILHPSFDVIKDSIITRITTDGDENFITVVENGIFRISNNGEIINFLSDDLIGGRVHKIIAGKDNNLWAATGKGLKKISGSNVSSFNYDPLNALSVYGDIIEDIFFDHSGMLWLSSYNRGISKVIFQKDNFQSNAASYVKSFSEDDDGNIWIGTMGEGLLKVSMKDHTSSVYDHNIKQVSSLIEEAGKIFYVNSQGLYEYETHSKRNTQILKNSFRTLLKIDDNIFLGTDGRGFFRYNLTNKKLQQLVFEFPGRNDHHNYILTFFADSRRRLWIGTYGGLIKLDLNNYKDELFKYDPVKPHTISNNYVYSVFEDKNKVIWTGTANGLNRFDEQANKFTRFYEKDGLPNGVINGITSDAENNLWITTNKGIAKFNPSDKMFTTYTGRNGLRENVFLPQSIFRDKYGFIYVGSANGFSYFHPDSITSSDYQPPVEVTSFISKNEELFPDNYSITLKPDQNYFNIRFASLDFKDPSRNNFRYLLEGMDKDWIYSGTSNNASYTNIPPGEYVFRVQGTNSDGIWSSNEARLNIIIFPPFYQTWWFLLISALLLMALFILFYKLRLRRKVELALAVEKARQEENEITRKKTAIDFHDELGHRLTRVSLMTELIRRQIPDPDVVLLLNKISDNVKELYTGMKDFVWAIDPKDDSLYELLVRLKDFGDDLFSNSSIYFEVNGFEESYKQLHLPMDFRRHLILLFKEGMNNSIKYAGSERVILDSQLYGNELVLSLTDFGKGLTPEHSVGRGIEGMKKRAEILKGELQIDSNPGTGTKIIFKGKLSLKDLHFN